MQIRKLSHRDLGDISRIQRECYSGRFIESADSFAAKLSAGPDFCFMAVKNEISLGYAVALPWVFGDIPDLGGLAYAVPSNANGLYIHDVAVAPAARKTGVARELLNAVLDAARSAGYQGVFLVAIKGASPYWKRYGFEAVEADERLMQCLSAYGEGARYMMKTSREK